MLVRLLSPDSSRKLYRPRTETVGHDVDGVVPRRHDLKGTLGIGLDLTRLTAHHNRGRPPQARLPRRPPALGLGRLPRPRARQRPPRAARNVCLGRLSGPGRRQERSDTAPSSMRTVQRPSSSPVGPIPVSVHVPAGRAIEKPPPSVLVVGTTTIVGRQGNGRLHQGPPWPAWKTTPSSCPSASAVVGKPSRKLRSREFRDILQWPLEVQWTEQKRSNLGFG